MRTNLVLVDDDVHLNVLELGTGPTVLLIHGWSLDHRVWDRQIRVLARSGCRVLAMDQRGHGSSDAPLHGYDIDRLAADALRVLDAFGADTATVVGWSLGGMVGLRMAGTAPHRLDALVLVASNGVAAARHPNFPYGAPPEPSLSTIIGAEHRDRIGLRRSAVGDPFGAAPDKHTLDWLHAISLETPSWAAEACMRTLLCTEQAALLDDLRIPVSQLVGVADPALSMRGARWVQSKVSSTLVEFDCGHYPMLELPDKFDRALLRAVSVSADSRLTSAPIT